jgi:hypothetical protein
MAHFIAVLNLMYLVDCMDDQTANSYAASSIIKLFLKGL